MQKKKQKMQHKTILEKHQKGKAKMYKKKRQKRK